MSRNTSFIARLTLAVAALVAVTACGVDKQEAPSLIGPSGFARSITITASPEQLPRDGRSRSTVTLTVRDENGAPIPGQQLTLTTTAGTLSQSDVFTGSDGRATVVLTAPAESSTATSIQITATPVGGLAAGSPSRSFTLDLRGSSAEFTVNPAAPGARETVTFDASGSICSGACTFTWDFGDNTSASGPIVTHTFATGGSYLVTVTVRDGEGVSSTARRTVAVSAVGAPSVTTPTVSPAAPLVGQQASFTTTGTAAQGHSIVRYTWDFGDGSAPVVTTTPSVVHTFTAAGNFVVTVIARDDLGQEGPASLQLTIDKGAAPTASFTFSPSSPGQFESISFNATASRPGVAGRSLTYDWNFGDGATSTGVTTTHAYSVLGTYTVTLLVTDSAGQQSSTTATVSVINGVTAAFTMSPTNPDTDDNVVFDAEASQGSSNGFGGRNQITKYIWNFGDPDSPTTVETSDRIIQHTYRQAKTYTIVLTVVDSAGRRATTSSTLTVSTAP